MNRKIYLASSSVWRASILKNAGISVDILPPEVDEYSIVADHPIQTATLRAIAKGESVFENAEDFRVLPEKWLSEPREHWIEELNCNVPDVITNRQYFFGNRYEDSAVLNTGQQSLSQLVEDNETLEEWFNRIKEDPRMKKKFAKKGEEGGWKYSDGQYAHLSIVDGKWVRV